MSPEEIALVKLRSLEERRDWAEERGHAANVRSLNHQILELAQEIATMRAEREADRLRTRRLAQWGWTIALVVGFVDFPSPLDDIVWVWLIVALVAGVVALALAGMGRLMDIKPEEDPAMYRTLARIFAWAPVWPVGLLVGIRALLA